MPDIRPFYTPSNPLYGEMDGERYQMLMTGLDLSARALDVNKPGSNALLSDDLMVWHRNLGFLSDERFVKACEGFESSSFIRAKLYRVYIYCWAINEAWCLGSRITACDLGTYDGKTIQIADRYMHGDLDWFLYDAYTEHPAKGNKDKHGAELVGEVKQRVPRATVVPGLLPDSLVSMPPLAFLHVDLNDPNAEIACLERLFDNMVMGGIVLLDDFGWSLYKESHDAHTVFFKSRGQSVLELPTGQGLVIKR